MSTGDIVIYLMIGLTAGLMSGMFGIGGGVVIVPLLILIAGFDIHIATGTSLAALLPPVSFLAVVQYYQRGLVRFNLVLPLMAGIVIGAWFGARIALSLPVETVQVAYGFFLWYIAWRFIEPVKLYHQWRHETVAPQREERDPALWVMLVVGFVAGVLSGMFGIAGGVIIVSVLVSFIHMNMHRATGTSLAALLLPVGLPAVFEYYRADELDVTAAILMASALVFGALGGARIALNLPSTQIKRLYGAFLVVIALRFLLPGLLS